MRLDLPWVVSILIGAVVAGALLLIFSSVPRTQVPPTRSTAATPAPPWRPAARPPVTPPPRGAGRVPAGARSTPAAQTPQTPASARPAAATPGLAAAERLVSAGRFREAQEAYLALLLASPEEPQALQGLVGVRRRLARDDPVLLRRQAAAYKQAIATRGETGEYYTPEAMRLLAEASLLAALEIEAEQGFTPSTPGAPRPTTTAESRPPIRPTVLSARPRATPRPRRTASPRIEVTPVRPSPAPTLRREATPTPSLDVNEPFSLVQIGPVYDATRASEIAAELTVAGYAARVSRPGGGSTYFITLGPYRQSVVNAILQTIKARFGAVPVTVTPAS